MPVLETVTRDLWWPWHDRGITEGSGRIPLAMIAKSRGVGGDHPCVCATLGLDGVWTHSDLNYWLSHPPWSEQGLLACLHNHHVWPGLCLLSKPVPKLTLGRHSSCWEQVHTESLDWEGVHNAYCVNIHRSQYSVDFLWNTWQIFYLVSKSSLINLCCTHTYVCVCMCVCVCVSDDSVWIDRWVCLLSLKNLVFLRAHDKTLSSNCARSVYTVARFFFWRHVCGQTSVWTLLHSIWWGVLNIGKLYYPQIFQMPNTTLSSHTRKMDCSHTYE